MSRRAVVFGAKGQLGVEITQELSRRGYQVESFERSRLDISNSAAVEQAIASAEPWVVFNAAAYNQVDIAEREPRTAFEANALGVRNLAVACRQCDAKLVHFSTDYVFDGTLGKPYKETDATHPIGAYAVSKLTGELYAQAYLADPVIIRTSGVFGPGGLQTARGNFPELMMRLAREGKPLRVVEDHVASPTYAPALAERSIDLAEGGYSGVFHVGGGQPISWFEWARLILECSGFQPGINVDLQPTNEREYRTAARRPKFSALENARLREVGVRPMPALSDALAEYLEKRKAWLA